MSRIEPAELRLMAERADVNGMPQYAQALRQAADDAEDAEDAERLRFIIDTRSSLRPILKSCWEVYSLDAIFRIGEGFEGDDARALIDTARKEPK